MTQPRKGAQQRVVLDGKTYRVLKYGVEEVQPLAQQIMSDLSMGQRSYKYETAARFLTWHLGFGLGEIRDDSDRGRYHYAVNCDARFRGQIILGPQLSTSAFTDGATAEAKVQFIQFSGSFFAIGARYVHIWNSGTNQWDTDKDMGASAAAVKGCATVYGSYLVVAAGGSVSYWRRTTGGVWDQPYATNKPILFALVGNTLWMVYGANNLSSSTDFITWSTAVAVGDALNVATMVTDYNGNPLVGKPEGLFEYDGTKVSNRLPDLASRLSATNCQGGKPSRGKLYLPIGPAVWQYTADAVQTEGKPTRSAEALAPGITRESSNEVRGSINDLWPDVDFLYGIFAAASGKYYIVAYDYNPNVGQGWHQVAQTSTTSTTALGRFQPASGNPRLFYSEGTAIKYFLLPANALNPYVDTAYRYALTGTINLPVEADTYDDVVKAYLAVKINVDNVDGTTKYVDVAYSLDGAAFTSLGRVKTSGISTLFFPSSTTGRRMALQLTLTTNDATVTPRVLPFSRHYKLRFDRKQYWKFNLVLGRHSLPNVLKAALDQLVDIESARSSSAPVAYTDVDDRGWTVFVEQLGREQPLDEGGDQVITVPVELLEWRSGLGINRWNDANTVYDDAARWSNGSDGNAAYWS